MGSDIPSGGEIAAMSDQDRKVLENRLRRAATRQGLRLEKSALRDPRALGYRTYQLMDEHGDVVLAAERGFGMDLRDIALHLYNGEPSGRSEAVPRRKPTTVGRRAVKHMVLQVNAIASAVRGIEPGEVDAVAMADELAQLVEDLGATRSWVEKVINDGR